MVRLIRSGIWRALLGTVLVSGFLLGTALVAGSLLGADEKPNAGKVTDDFSDFDAKRWIIKENVMRFAEAKDKDGQQRRVLLIERSMKQMALVRDYEFTNGTIEFEFKGGRWLGLSFHVQKDGQTAEIIYFRNPKIAGWPKCIRYYARIDGKEVEGLESGEIPLPPTAPVEKLLEPEGWVKVKCVITGPEAQIFVDGSKQPVFTISKLHLAGQTGSVGVYGWDGAFANYKVTRAKK